MICARRSVSEFLLPVVIAGMPASTNGNDIALHFTSGKEQFGIFGCRIGDVRKRRQN
jgi:hypothetical protein